MNFVLKIFTYSICMTLMMTACGGGSSRDAASGNNGSPTSFIVTPSAGANGTIFPSGPKTVLTGGTISFTVTPVIGYSSAVAGCGGSLAGNIFTTGAINSDCTVSASFVPSQFSVTPSSGSNGSITPGTVQTVVYNGTASFIVSPALTFSIVSVTGCGGSLSGSTYSTGAITGNCTVSASFVLNQYPVTTRVTSGTGSIFCTPTSPVTAGNDVNCSITPGSGYQLANLADNSANVTGSVSGAGAYSISGIAAAHDLAVAFSLKQYAVTPAVGANGVITPGGQQIVVHGAQPNFTLLPNAGYYGASAAGCGGTLSGGTYTTAPVTGDCTVSAVFAHYTAGALSLSVAAEPSTLGFLDVDILLPAGVLAASSTPGVDPDVLDISSSVNPPPLAATYTISTRTIRLIYFQNIGLGSLATVALTVAPTAAVTSASFPSTATVLLASDTGLVDIPNPSSVIQIPVSVTLN